MTTGVGYTSERTTHPATHMDTHARMNARTHDRIKISVVSSNHLTFAVKKTEDDGAKASRHKPNDPRLKSSGFRCGRLRL